MPNSISIEPHANDCWPNSSASTIVGFARTAAAHQPRRNSGNATNVATTQPMVPMTVHSVTAQSPRSGQASAAVVQFTNPYGYAYASPCPNCARILVPPRNFCEDCFVPTADDWVEVGPDGVVESFTFTYARFAGYADPPYGVAYVRPDGATTAIANFVTGVDFTDPAAAAAHLAIGTRMRAVFRPDRAARITDFTWTPV